MVAIVLYLPPLDIVRACGVWNVSRCVHHVAGPHGHIQASEGFFSEEIFIFTFEIEHNIKNNKTFANLSMVFTFYANKVLDIIL